MRAEPPILTFATPSDWEHWLAAHENQTEGVWLKFAKKGSGIPSVHYPEALDTALCHGWIDGQVKPVDGTHYLQRFTPRRPRSPWSKRNCAKALALLAEGKMQPSGLAQVEAAQRDGRWAAAYDSPRTATVPPDLEEALGRNPAARDFFATLTGRNRYATLYRLQEAKRPETRARRLAQFVEMLAERRTLHP